MTRGRLWRSFAVALGLVLFAFVVMDCAAALFANAQLAFTGTFDADRPGVLVVQTIDHPASIDGPVHLGDRVRLEDASMANRLRFTRERPGERFAFVGTTANGRPTRFVMTMTPGGAVPPTFWIYQIMRAVLVVVGLLVAVRRPGDPVARTLVGLFFSLAAVLESGTPWFTPAITFATIVVHGFCQIFAAYCALSLAVSFPQRSAHGVRRLLERLNRPYAGACILSVFAGLAFVLFGGRRPPAMLQTLGVVETVLYFIAITVAFVVGGRGAAGADRKRAQWVSWTLAAGFSGSLVQTILFALHVPIGPVYAYFGLTLLAIPLGLGYAIVRHRVVDIGFVVNRALVFGIVSAIVVVAFMVLEWALSSVFVRVSHITSTSLELGLALVLGFSLRSIHSRIDGLVDDLFFRARHEAERALKTFAREVSFITDPRVAIERTHRELLAHTGASDIAIYLVEGRFAVRVDPPDGTAANRVGIDDAALVRMRAARIVCDLRSIAATHLIGDHAFPMCVRDAVIGIVVVGPKANGEAYAPDELATIEMVALAAGNALDALQTAALKAEVTRVLLGGASLDELRGTLDPVAWLRGPVPQPAGRVIGLGE